MKVCTIAHPRPATERLETDLARLHSRNAPTKLQKLRNNDGQQPSSQADARAEMWRRIREGAPRPRVRNAVEQQIEARVEELVCAGDVVIPRPYGAYLRNYFEEPHLGLPEYCILDALRWGILHGFTAAEDLRGLSFLDLLYLAEPCGWWDLGRALRIRDDREKVSPNWTGTQYIQPLSGDGSEFLDRCCEDLVLEADRGRIKRPPGQLPALRRLMDEVAEPSSAVCIVGPSGKVGSSLVEGLAAMIAEGDVLPALRDARIMRLKRRADSGSKEGVDPSSDAGMSSFWTNLEELLETNSSASKTQRIILFLDGIGREEVWPVRFVNRLAEVLSMRKDRSYYRDGKVNLLATSSEDEYAHLSGSQDPARGRGNILNTAFWPALQIPSSGRGLERWSINASLAEFAGRHGIVFSDDALDTAYRLAALAIAVRADDSTEVLPFATVLLEGAARVLMSTWNDIPPEIRALEKEIGKIRLSQLCGSVDGVGQAMGRDGEAPKIDQLEARKSQVWEAVERERDLLRELQTLADGIEGGEGKGTRARKTKSECLKEIRRVRAALEALEKRQYGSEVTKRHVEEYMDFLRALRLSNADSRTQFPRVEL